MKHKVAILTTKSKVETTPVIIMATSSSISIMENIKQKNLEIIYKILSKQNLEYFTNDLDQIIVSLKDDTVVISIYNNENMTIYSKCTTAVHGINGDHEKHLSRVINDYCIT